MLPPRLYSASTTATAFPYFPKPLLRLRRLSASAPSRSATAAALRTQRFASVHGCLSTTSPPSASAFAACSSPFLSRRTLSSFAPAQPVCLGQAPEASQQPAMTIPTRSSSADDHDEYVDCSPFRLRVRVKPIHCFRARVLGAP